MTSNFLFIGHRGTRRDFDENTILAFKKAKEFGANYIEFDVRKTKDNKLAVLHDSYLDRTTDGTGLLKDFTYEEIRVVKTVINKSTIPLLTEVLDEFKGKINFMIELKEEDLVDDVVEVIKVKNLIGNIIISGKRLYDLLGIKSKVPHIRICFNITNGIGLTLEEFLKSEEEVKKKFKLDMISLNSNLISQKFIEKCHVNEVMALSWDFLSYKNPITKINSLISKGIDGILFDDFHNIKKFRMGMV
ncbi:MAG: glycerophosphodiester phosphodiesterase [Candidatus Hodarchaeales archaeon]|jgi:glycerophosphoryl diester phosphodiesterase